ncbi:hypothetical protein N7448_009736 [Penicillium atrosanguineum]|nr:hypothetical protein N7448_009736 [Penicillium atrosanguineum]
MGPTNIPSWARSVWARSTASDLESVPSTFSSWDKCMAKSYCKWPVIVGIIIAAVIVIAILGCIINCICCGYQCCKCCCSCCCPSGRRRNKAPKQAKHYDDPIYTQPPPAPNPIYQPPPAPPVYRGANTTATFDSTSKSGATSTINEDALPEMPTWAAAVDKHVEDHFHEDVEMEPLSPPDHRQGAGTPGHTGAAYADYAPDRGTTPLAGYRGFNHTDPYARRSPGPAAALAATQDPYGRRSPGAPLALNPQVDPYGRRSPGVASPAVAAAVDPYNRRSPGPNAAMDPYGRRSPAPAAAYAAQDPYGRRSPGPNAVMSPYGHHSPGSLNNASPIDPYGRLKSPVGAPVSSPYEHQPYNQPYDDYSNSYHPVSSPSPVAAYQPQTNYSPIHGSEPHPQAPGFTRQPSFGSSQYPPTYTSQPSYRGAHPSISGSPPPPFQSQAPSEYTAYGSHAQDQGHQYGVEASDTNRDRPPSLLMSGRKPAPNTYRDV